VVAAIRLSLPHPMLQRNNYLHALQQAHPKPGQGTGKTMDIQSIIIWLVVGAIAGWLAGMVMKGGGFGLIGDIIVGIVGAVIAGWLLPQLGIFIGGGFVAAIIDAFIGAVILLLIIKLVKRA
jgi:uncharacterized membrane protein YeaQ/YmgE (transglycosylase-associated protein family)